MADDELLTMDPKEQFDPCILGVAQRFNSRFVVYDRACVIAKLMGDGMDEEGAEEYFEFNVLGAWVGEFTPAYLEPLTDD